LRQPDRGLGRWGGSQARTSTRPNLAFRVVGRVSGYDVVGYLVAQLVGALSGAVVFRLLWGSVALSVDGGVTHPAVATLSAIGIEAGMTALLVAMIFVFLSREGLARGTPLMLWPLVGVLVWKGSSYTGTSLNPARSAGPALAFSDFADLWLYFVAPIFGALAVAGVAESPPQDLAADGQALPRPRLPLLAGLRASRAPAGSSHP
jgi:glycerol uptake facilitator-like aquaporin